MAAAPGAAAAAAAGGAGGVLSASQVAMPLLAARRGLSGASPAGTTGCWRTQPALPIASPSRPEGVGQAGVFRAPPAGASPALATSLLAFGAAAAGAARARARRCRALQVVARRGARTSTISYDSLYRPLNSDAEPDQDSGDDRRGGRARRNSAPWKRENAEQREDPSYGKQWVWDPKRRGAKFRKFAKGQVVDRTQEIEDQASSLRARYKRPRFGWQEVQKDDLRTSRLSSDLPAIGSGEVWLSKYLAHSGACSRRKVTEMVLQGRVMVNGEVVRDPVMKVNPVSDRVMLDGMKQELTTLGEIVWIMLHKPKGVITTFEDSEGRKTVMDLVPFAKQRRLVPVGRIDRNACGLVILTNDYEWHTILAHPRYEHTKRYRVDLYNGVPSRAKLQAIQNGLELPDENRPLLPLEDFQVSAENKREEIASVQFTMRQGKYRQIRRMFEYIGHPVRSIKRTQFGLIKLDRALKAGEWRMLSPKEIRRLKGPTILKRPQKHPFDTAKEQRQMASRLDEAELEPEDLSEHDRRAIDRERHLQSQGQRQERSRGRRAAQMEIDEEEWDDSESMSGGRGRDLDQRPVREVRRFQEGRSSSAWDVRSRVAEGFSGWRQDRKEERQERRQERGRERAPEAREASMEDRKEERQERRQERGRERAPEAREASMEDLQALQQRFGSPSAGSSGAAPDFDRRSQERQPEERELTLEDLQSRFNAAASSGAGGRAAIRSGKQAEEKSDRAPEEKVEAREATMEDLQTLQRRFDKVSAATTGPAPNIDDDWEADWVKQLDAMQAERAAQDGTPQR